MKVYLVSEESYWLPDKHVVIIDGLDELMPHCKCTDDEKFYIHTEHLKEVDIDWETAKLIDSL